MFQEDYNLRCLGAQSRLMSYHGPEPALTWTVYATFREWLLAGSAFGCGSGRMDWLRWGRGLIRSCRLQAHKGVKRCVWHAPCQFELTQQHRHLLLLREALAAYYGQARGWQVQLALMLDKRVSCASELGWLVKLHDTVAAYHRPCMQ